MNTFSGEHVSIHSFEAIAPCTRPWTALFEFSVFGDYKVCCWIDAIIGNITKNSNDDIMGLWNNSKIVEVRKSMLNGLFSRLCPSSCPVLRKRKRFFNLLEFYDYDAHEYAKFDQEFRKNRETIIRSILQKKLVLNGFPLRLKLHPSNTCNLKCRMCHLDKSLKVPVNENYYKNIYKLLPYLEELEVFGGDPFACKLTRELIFGEKLRKYPQVHLSTVTNGTLLNENVLEQLKGLRLGHFDFSLDGCTEETYNQIRINGSYPKTIENIQRFVHERDKGNICVQNIGLLFVIQSINYREISRFIELAHTLKISVGFSLVEGSTELLDELDAVKGSILEGIAKARELGDTKAAEDLSHLLKRIPKYSTRASNLKHLFKIFRVADRDKISAFFEKHRSLKRSLKKLLGL